MRLLLSSTLWCFFFSSFVYADFKSNISLLDAEEYEAREKAHSQLDAWLLKNPTTAKKKLFEALRNEEDPEASSRLYELLRKSVIVEKFGPNPGFLGIRMMNTNIQLEDGNKIYAVAVVEVVKESAAQQAGIMVGDKIIEADGRPFTIDAGNTPDKQLMNIIQSKAPKERIEIKVLSGGLEKMMNIELGEMTKLVRKKWQKDKFPEEMRDVDEFFADWLLENTDW